MLRLVIEPIKVRLVNTDKEGYTWLFRPEVAHLFRKNFSQYGDSAFKELCAGIGVSFEAAPSSSTPHVGIGKGRESALSTSRQQQEVRSTDAATGEEATRSDQVAPLQKISQLEEQLSVAEAKERRGMVERIIAGEILLSKCMYVLASMPTSILELRDEIRDAIGRDAFDTS
ncbi:TPR domain protein [Purpureocillium lavendulum]|uniref:TPR domain protein n=1 Tax=Purpureocillium lavendulum TaxID=1247861 RepID=A0AB34FB87_9HYPO|nr:TPR domain protein [Purpureocillium lavendulum]